MSTLLMWNKVFDVDTKHVVELYGIDENLNLVKYQILSQGGVLSQGPVYLRC